MTLRHYLFSAFVSGEAVRDRLSVLTLFFAPVPLRYDPCLTDQTKDEHNDTPELLANLPN